MRMSQRWIPERLVELPSLLGTSYLYIKIFSAQAIFLRVDFSGREPRPGGYGVTGVTATGWQSMRVCTHWAEPLPIGPMGHIGPMGRDSAPSSVPTGRLAASKNAQTPFTGGTPALRSDLGIDVDADDVRE